MYKDINSFFGLKHDLGFGIITNARKPCTPKRKIVPSLKCDIIKLVTVKYLHFKKIITEYQDIN